MLHNYKAAEFEMQKRALVQQWDGTYTQETIRVVRRPQDFSVPATQLPKVFSNQPSTSTQTKPMMLPTPSRLKPAAHGGLGAMDTKRVWSCDVCRKNLSSKRSYTEHMNTHYNSRPFQCDQCDYAAASQMTLHRHKLRIHTPKDEWGYICPYCPYSYMEPACYQVHVQNKHHGSPSTYGCPDPVCDFFTKSQRHFREHLVKHKNMEEFLIGECPTTVAKEALNVYLVKDTHGNSKLRKRSAPPNDMMPVKLIKREPSQPVPRTLQEAFNDGQAVSVRRVNPTQYVYRNVHTVKLAPPRSNDVDSGEPLEPPPILHKETEGECEQVMFDEDEVYEEEVVDDEVYGDQNANDVVNGWIENEIEVDSQKIMFPNGFIEDELD